jgi:hypothetical protein
MILIREFKILSTTCRQGPTYVLTLSRPKTGFAGALAIHERGGDGELGRGL